MTADTRFLSIPEADTGQVARAVVELTGVSKGRTQRVRNMFPWQPDIILIYGRKRDPIVVISRLCKQEGDGEYIPTDDYKITIERRGIAFDQITAEEIARVVRTNRRPLRSFMDRIWGLRG